jgi:membrane protein implicated in regulation of membrane protease activity
LISSKVSLAAGAIGLTFAIIGLIGSVSAAIAFAILGQGGFVALFVVVAVLDLALLIVDAAFLAKNSAENRRIDKRVKEIDRQLKFSAGDLEPPASPQFVVLRF